MSQLPRGPHFCACGNHAWGVLTKGFVTLVDTMDAPILERPWCAAVSGPKSVYAVRGTSGESELLHTVIAAPGRGMEADHANRNPLDNRRHNLRVATRRQNCANMAHKNKHGMRGVVQVKETGKWRAQIRINKRTTHLGTFTTIEAAAEAYRKAAAAEFGEFAYAEAA